MAKLRTFIAVAATEEIRKQAEQLAEKLSHTLANVKWVERRNLHWTVKFLGDVDSNDIPSICQAVGTVVGEIPPFEIIAQGAGAFPTLSRPRTVWLGTGRGDSQFVSLHNAADSALVKLDFRSEHRRFRPHMTLGRVRRSPQGVDQLGTLIAEHDKFDAGSMIVDELVIFTSQLDRDGPTYQVLARLPLSG
jgi:2'-5' RNA ligase